MNCLDIVSMKEHIPCIKRVPYYEKNNFDLVQIKALKFPSDRSTGEVNRFVWIN